MLRDFFRRSQKPERLPNIAVYCLRSIDQHGNARTAAIGVMPRFSTEYEKTIRDKHKPIGTIYINDNIGNVSFVLAWMNDRIEAVSFLSEEQARAAAGFIAFEDNQFDSVLTHFPR
jgi:hypothetical protein